MMMRTAALAVLLTAVAQPASGQSLYNTRGLGTPAPALDGRAAALGGIGVGLIGFHTSMTSPAEMAGVTRRGVSAVLQPVTTSAELDGASDGTTGTRFPVLRIIYPINDRLVMSLGYGSWLEQSWAVRTESEQMIGDQNVTVTDVLQSIGGIAQLRLGAAYQISPTLSVGAAAGLYTGNIERRARRSFAGDTTAQLAPFENRLRWTYLAPLGSVGVRWDIAGRARLGASVTAGGSLDASGSDGNAQERSYGAPLEFAGGGSTRISQLLTANAGIVWTRPPSTDGPVTSRETIRAGGGLEYQGVASGARTYPIRLGARWEQLPYHLDSESAAEELALGAGIGFRLGDPANPAAVVDFGLERARRTGLGSTSGELSEGLWRFTFSLSLFGN
ncbi:MAG TPA: hypothetical protein VK929_06805 [Longimicrobiales bacterium]|nr:hypothetical protein [Longimicrobiales bacterium]